MSDGMTLESIQQPVVVLGRIAAVVELTPRTTLTTPSAASSRASMGLAATIVDGRAAVAWVTRSPQDTAGVHLLAFIFVVSNLAQLLTHSLSRSSCSAMLCRHPSTRDVRVD
jgi:hypothetical protein